MSTSDGIPDTGYDKKLNVNYTLLIRTLNKLGYDEFLEACPRFGDFVTSLDLDKLVMFRGVAEAFADESIEKPENVMDPAVFNDVKGKVVGSITEEIKRGDPKDKMIEMYERKAESDSEALEEAAYRYYEEHGEELIKKLHIEGQDYGSVVKAIGQLKEELNKSIKEGMENAQREISELKTDLEEHIRSAVEPQKARGDQTLMELTDAAATPAENDTGQNQSDEELPFISVRTGKLWSVLADQETGEVIVAKEKYSRFPEGSANLTLVTNYGVITWPLVLRQNGGETLYSRLKRSLMEYLGTGNLLTSDPYYPVDRSDKRIYFGPKFESGKVVRQGTIGAIKDRYQDITISLDSSSMTFSLEFSMWGRVENWDTFVLGITSLIEQVLLSSLEIKDGEK